MVFISQISALRSNEMLHPTLTSEYKLKQLQKKFSVFARNIQTNIDKTKGKKPANKDTREYMHEFYVLSLNTFDKKPCPIPFKKSPKLKTIFTLCTISTMGCYSIYKYYLENSLENILKQKKWSSASIQKGLWCGKIAALSLGLALGYSLSYIFDVILKNKKLKKEYTQKRMQKRQKLSTNLRNFLCNPGPGVYFFHNNIF